MFFSKARKWKKVGDAVLAEVHPLVLLAERQTGQKIRVATRRPLSGPVGRPPLPGRHESELPALEQSFVPSDMLGETATVEIRT